MELNLVVGGINAAAIKPTYHQREGGRGGGGRGRGGGRSGGGERRDRGPRDGNGSGSGHVRDGQGEQKAEEAKADSTQVDSLPAEKPSSDPQAVPLDPSPATEASAKETVDPTKKDSAKPAEKAADAPKPIENRPSLASLQKLKAPPKNNSNNNQTKKHNATSAASETKPAFEIEYDIVAVKDPSKPAPAPATTNNNKNNNQKSQGKGQQQEAPTEKTDSKHETKVETPSTPQKGQQKKQSQKKEAVEEKAEESMTHKDDVFVDLPSPLSEKLISGQQALIEVNGCLYLKLDPKKIDPAWLKAVQTSFEKNKAKEQVTGGFFLVDKTKK